MLFILLTGQRPFKEKGADAIKKVGSDSRAPSPLERLAIIPPPLAAICEKAMQKEPSKRIQNGGELAKELKAYRDGRLVSVYTYTKKELLKRSLSQNKTATGAFALLLLSVILGAAFSMDFAIKAKSSQLKAENALVNIIGLTESTSDLAQKTASYSQKYFKELSEKMTAQDYRKKLAEPASLFPAALGMEPTQSIYQIWVMGDDGKIIYDEDPAQVGKILFSDDTYKGFPELMEIGKEIAKKDWGIGFYRFGYKGNISPVSKIAAWSTVRPEEGSKWSIIATLPYAER